MKSSRRPVSEFPNDNNALHAGTMWLCLEPTARARPVTSSLAVHEAQAEQKRNGPLPAILPPPLQPRGAAVAATPPPPLSASARYVGTDDDFEVPELDFSFDDGPAPYELPPVVPAPPTADCSHDYVKFFPPPADLWKRELGAVDPEPASDSAPELRPPPPETPLPDVVVARLSTLTVTDLGDPVSQGRAPLAHAFTDAAPGLPVHPRGECAIEDSAIQGATPVGSELPPPVRTASWLAAPIAITSSSIDEAVASFLDATPSPSPALAGAWGEAVAKARLAEPRVPDILDELEAIRAADDARAEAREGEESRLDTIGDLLDAAFSDSIGALPSPSASLAAGVMRSASLASSGGDFVETSDDPPEMDRIGAFLDSAFEPLPESGVRIEPTFTSMQSFGRLVDACTLAPPLKILASAASELPDANDPRDVAPRVESGVRELTPAVREPAVSLGRLHLDLTPEPGVVELVAGAPELAVATAVESAETPPPAEDQKPDAFERLCGAMAAVALERGATRAAACIPRLIAGEKVTESELSSEAIEALARGGFAEHRRPFVVPSDGFVATMTAWRRIMRGESDDLSACGNDTLDAWASGFLASLLGLERAVVRKDVRKQGIAAFGMKRAA